ncbi:MAG: alpha/beta hydrolase [Halieaceae bacterium]|jgi:pimeloyl-ACP methyl ester carboxylesterase|nr:alpha/beta hydrolase [Halieaceae bacterium]
MIRTRQFLAFFLLASFAALALSARSAELQRHTVSVDGHPFAVWEKSAPDASEAILLVHGRTWSALPDFDLQVEGEQLSFMDSLARAGYATFAVDLRGYGSTPRDPSGWMTPKQAAGDVAAVLAWIAQQQDWALEPHLFGWSMGSSISHLTAQTRPELLASLTLYGFWKDLDEPEAEDTPNMQPLRIVNTAEAAASDFITPGSISQRAIDVYVQASIEADPIKTDIRSLSDYNELDPAKLTMPTLVIVGEHDPIAPQAKQAKLFERIGTGHKQWVVVPGGDHAAHLEAPRDYFLRQFITFLEGVPR